MLTQVVKALFLVCLLVLAHADTTNLNTVISNNQAWVTTKTSSNATFFSDHATGQAPTYLWIGCSDSRVPPNLLLGLDVGEVFVCRNIANTAQPSDISVQAILQYTIDVLKVTDIIVAGHTLCGGVAAALNVNDYGPLEAYLSEIRHLSNTHSTELSALTGDAKTNRLVEINVEQQVSNIAGTRFAQLAWNRSQTLNIHGVVYDLGTGTLTNRNVTKTGLSDVPASLKIL